MINYNISPNLTLKNITEIIQDFGIFLNKKTNHAIVVDLTKINEIDSAGVALLIELKKIATKHKCTLEYHNTPLKVNNLLQLYKINVK